MINQNWFNSKDFNPGNYVISCILVYMRAMYIYNQIFGYDVWEEGSSNEPQNRSKLVISDQNTWDTTHRGHLPSIVLRRGLMSFGGGIQDGGASRVIQAGFSSETSVMEIVSVPVVLSCIARQDLESEALAVLTTQFLWDDKRWMKPFQIFGMTSPQISDSQPYNLSDNSFKTDIAFSISIARKYTTRMLPDDKVQKLALSINNQQNLEIKS